MIFAENVKSRIRAQSEFSYCHAVKSIHESIHRNFSLLGKILWFNHFSNSGKLIDDLLITQIESIEFIHRNTLKRIGAWHVFSPSICSFFN